MNAKVLKIGNVELDSPFLLAPMAGITDGPFRRICREMGAGLVYSEMVSAKGLWFKDKNTGRLLEILDGEEPVAYQLFGHEPEIMAFAAETLAGRGNVIFDINMGCPVPKVVKNGEGSALMKDPQLVFDLVEAAVKGAGKPVTVKIRAGWDEASVNAVEVARAAAAGGAAAVAVHARTREQFYSGRADRAVIAAVKHAVSIPVIGNGDVTDGASGMSMMDETGCDFVMVGRGALGNPWIFSQINAYLENPNVKIHTPDLEERLGVMIEHISKMVEYKGEHMAMLQARKLVVGYFKGMKGAAALRNEAGKIKTLDDLYELRQKALSLQ
mgnify:CR=1 FL=1